MDDQYTDSATTRGLFVLVGPAAVVGHGLALEELLIVGGRFIDDDEGDFAFEVDTGVVVPVVFGGMDAVADKDNRRIDFGIGWPV